MKIQHNIPAMNAYRNYTNNVSAVAKNLEKLSSGYRINRAGDDAAGLAISEKMRAQITGLATAQKNAKDGISLIQTAEGALTEVHSMLNRMFELAEQSANGTYDNEVDRANLQKEFDALRAEIDRVADSSNFNGQKLLDGTLSSEVKITNGAITNAYVKGGVEGNSSGLIELQEFLTGAATSPVHGTNTILSGKETEASVSSFEIDLGNLTVDVATESSLTLTVGTVTLAKDASGTAIELAKNTSDTDTALASNDDIMSVVRALSGTKVYLGDKEFDADFADGKLKLTQTVSNATDKGHYKIGTTGGEGQVVAIAGGTAVSPTSMNEHTISINQGTAAIPAQRANTQFALNPSSGPIIKDGGQLTIGDTTYTFAMGKDSKFAGGKNVIDLTEYKDLTTADPTSGLTAVQKAGQLLSQQNNSVFTIGFNGTDLTFEEKEGQTVMDLSTENGIEKAFGTSTAKATSPAGKGLTLQIGDTADSYNMLTVSVADMHAEALGIGKDINISEQGMSQKAMDAIKNAINSVSSTRGDLGALQNRLDHTINNLGVMEENIQDAEASIRDTDVAKEMMAYTKNNILVQASQAMLAQANQLPQGVLQLLG